ncbi:HNH endonuclease signature motif containing protein [Pseudonocardia nigra]|uniref:HNH endonuclease signature motif containing protein n=1 Tax=Pseudonocardia nigra TaxID=1921578 RepID=UPI001C5F6E72|nr:HNH endonuclease signature motif containing protein [Pseudonocardia nigra]
MPAAILEVEHQFDLLEVVVSATLVATLPTTAARARFQAMSTRDVETELLGLAGHIAAAQCRFLQLLAEFDRRDGWAGPGLRSCAHWLSWRAGMSRRTAAEHVRVAHALERLPRITEAFAAGRISYSKVRAITRITGADSATITACTATAGAGPTTGGSSTPDVDPLNPLDRPDPAEATETDPPATPAGPAAAPEVTGPDPAMAGPTGPDPSGGDPTVPDPEVADRVLLNLALSGTASHVETVVRAVRRRRAAPTDTAARRGLSWHWADDGSLVVRGRFTPDEGAALIAAVGPLVPPRGPVHHPVPASPPGWRERAVEEEPGPAVDRVAARRADALLALVTGRTATGKEEVAPVVARGDAHVVVHLDTTTGTARLDGGPELPATTAERLACDARVQLLLDDRRNNRLHLGRARRLASPAQIAALTARDGGRCQFPGCTHTRFLHAHHVRPWLRGGPTDIDNLVLVCGFHHRVIHDHGYRIRRLPGRWEILRPDGTPVPATGAPLTGNTERLIESATRAGLHITGNSLTPNWGGERLDPEPILDALLPYRGKAAA